MIERIESLEDFQRLATDWNVLLSQSRSDCLFLTWEWLYTWWKHLSENRRLFLLRVNSGNELVALAPLVRNPAQLTRFRCSSRIEASCHFSSSALRLSVVTAATSNVINELVPTNEINSNKETFALG